LKIYKIIIILLQESDEIPKDFTTMFDTHLFKLDTSLIPEAIKLYDVSK